MDIVENAPEGWQLVVRKEDGKIVEVYQDLVEDKPNGESVEHIDNVIFQGRLAYLGLVRKRTHSQHHVFRDEQSGVVCRFSPKTTEMLFEAVLDGSVEVVDGVLEGLFTFAKYGDYYFVYPLSAADKADRGLG